MILIFQMSSRSFLWPFYASFLSLSFTPFVLQYLVYVDSSQGDGNLYLSCQETLARVN